MAITALFISLAPTASASNRPDSTATTIVIDASAPSPKPAPLDIHMGTAVSPTGRVLGINSQYLTLDGSPWLPVMGEFHFSRYPESYWEEEILKMKAAGVQIVATYLFWIHHEEVEGQFDWAGQRNLRRFVELCGKHGLLVYPRIGPFSHGEARNGGLPDWVRAQERIRRNDPIYLGYVRRYFGEIGRQLKGLLWKDGGPVIGVQLENEYYVPGAEPAHIAELKRIARAAGLDVPFYSVTGWGDAAFPSDAVVPVFGAYPDDFWSSSLDEAGPNGNYLFDAGRAAGAGPEPTVREQRDSFSRYPYIMAEAGGGMEVAYHRRPVIAADDVAAITLVRLGDGANLYGYYMFHGGTNPQGRLSTLQESAATDGVYDLPVLSYDFQAPIREFGQLNSSYRVLKSFHLFLNDFGDRLAPMRPFSPVKRPAGFSDVETPRVSVRAEGDRAFVFFNNYARHQRMKEHTGTQLVVKMPSETITFPRTPINVPSGSYFIWPVNFDVDGAMLKYASAQSLCKVRHGSESWYFFSATPGITPELAFDAATVADIQVASGVVSREANRIAISGIRPGSRSVIRIRTNNGNRANLVILTRDQALNTWKWVQGGREHIIMSPADVFFAGNKLHLRARNPRELAFAAFPPLASKNVTKPSRVSAARDGIFTAYEAQGKTVSTASVRWQKRRDATKPAQIRRGNYNALAPTDDDFNSAATWRITIPLDLLEGRDDVFLRIRYQGDVARLYSGDTLLADNFYKGTDWEVGLKRFAGGLPRTSDGSRYFDLKIVPLRDDAPIYFPRDRWPTFPSGHQVAELVNIETLPEYETVIQTNPESVK